jgi:hypothetical protein
MYIPKSSYKFAVEENLLTIKLGWWSGSSGRASAQQV